MNNVAVLDDSARSQTHLLLNDVTLTGSVQCLLSLGLCGLFLFLLLLLSELLDPLQLLLDRSCLDGHYVPNLCRQCSVIVRFRSLDTVV